MARRARVCYLLNTCIVVRYTPGHSGIHPRASILTMIVAVLYNRDAMRNDNRPTGIGRPIYLGQKCVRSARPIVIANMRSMSCARSEEERSNLQIFVRGLSRGRLLPLPISLGNCFQAREIFTRPSIVISRPKKNFTRLPWGKISVSRGRFSFSSRSSRGEEFERISWILPWDLKQEIIVDRRDCNYTVARVIEFSTQ